MMVSMTLPLVLVFEHPQRGFCEFKSPATITGVESWLIMFLILTFSMVRLDGK